MTQDKLSPKYSGRFNQLKLVVLTLNMEINHYI